MAFPAADRASRPAARAALVVLGLIVGVALGLLGARLLTGDSAGGARTTSGSAEVEGEVDTAVIRLEPGDDFAAETAAGGPGTTYVVAAGVHRLQTLIPADGDVILGEAGAVMSGAEVLDPAAFTRDGGVWILDGRGEEPFIHGQMLDGFARDAAHHELWAGPERLRHVETRAAVDTPGEWFFDYDADQIIIADPPDRRGTLELSVTDVAIASDADDVTVRGLTITRYSSPSQRGAIQPQGEGWLLDELVVSENHGGAILMGDHTTVTGSLVLNNGQWGVGASGAAGLRVEDTEIAYNGTLGYEWFWEAGGTKFKGTADAVVAGNRVHHNAGPGIWFDLDNTDITVSGNVVEHNDVIGIYLEVSDGAVVQGNTVRHNGFGEAAGDLGAGISIQLVSDALVTDNVVSGNALELTAVHYDRRSEITGTPFTIDGLEVTANTFRATSDGAVSFFVGTDEADLYEGDRVVFEENHYVLDGCEPCFRWGDLVDADTWQQLGNDVQGTFDRR